MPSWPLRSAHRFNWLYAVQPWNGRKCFGSSRLHRVCGRVLWRLLRPHGLLSVQPREFCAFFGRDVVRAVSTRKFCGERRCACMRSVRPRYISERAWRLQLFRVRAWKLQQRTGWRRLHSVPSFDVF